MTNETIYNNYAIEQGFDSLRHLLRYSYSDEIQIHINSVTDLIQEELKKKIHDKVINNDISFVIDELGILKTEIL